MSYSLGRHCAICGAPITDDNPDGIGFECREVLHKKMISLAFDLHKGDMSEYWNCGLPMLITQVSKMLNAHVGKKAYRSSFKKTFLTSVYTQMSEKNFLSKKQSEILIKIIEEEDVYFSQNYYTFVNTERKRILKQWVEDV